MENRSKWSKMTDKNLKAMGAGERTSKKVSTIRKADGTSFRRKNANQYGAAEGGNDYTEKRVNRTDRFDLGGTADSSENGGANIGGTLGSSMMKKGGNLIGKQKNLDLNKNGKLDSEDFKMIRANKKANGGGLADVPESFPETDAMSYGEGGTTKTEFMDKIKKAMKEKNKWHFIQDSVEGNSVSIKMFVGNKEVDVQRFIVNGLHGGLPKNYQGVMATTKMIDEFINNLSKKEYANGGSTKGFEYSIGGL